MKIINSKNIFFLLFGMVLAKLLVSCTPMQSELVATLAYTPKPTAILISTVILETSPTINSSLSSTATPTPTPSPTNEIEELSKFNGLVAIQVSDRNSTDSQIVLLAHPFNSPEILLSEKGISFTQPLFSPNGRYLAYLRHEANNISVWVMEIKTRQTKQWSKNFLVTQSNLQGFLVDQNGLTLQSWAPDETALIFQAWEKHTSSEEPFWSYLLFSNGDMSPIGSQVLDISWHSNEVTQELIFLSQFNGIYRLNITNPSTPTLLLEIPDLYGGSVAWHQNGQDIAISADLETSTSLWLFKINTGEKNELASGEHGFQLIMWSESNNLLYWRSGEKNKILQFDRDDLVSHTVIPFNNKDSMILRRPSNLWLNNNTIGLIQMSPTRFTDINLCFYSIYDKTTDCPINFTHILQKLSLNENDARIAITWAKSE